MKKSKQILAALFYVAVLTVLAFSLNVSAESIGGTCGSGIGWVFNRDTGTLTITGTGDMTYYSSSSKIPWYNYRESITSIVIKDGMTGIGNFEDCSNLTSVTIPASVTSIDIYAFKNCSSLKSVYITDIAAWCGISFGTSDSNPLYYDGDLYLNGELVEEVIIPDGVTSIGNFAFYHYGNLTSITIPTSMTSIGNSAFSGCSALNEVNYDGSEDDWFAIELGSGNTYLSNVCGLYSGTCGDDLTWHLVISTGVLTISGSGDMNDYSSSSTSDFRSHATSITTIIISEDVTNIGDYAFYNCSNLSSITIPDHIASIGMSAFKGCTNLMSITIPNGVTYISYDAFYGCTNLTSVIICDGVTSIGASAFEECCNLKSITIPVSVTSISYDAFNNCTALSEVNYDGSEDDWIAIDIGTRNTYLIDAYGLYSGTCGSDLTWKFNINTGILTIRGSGDMYNYSGSPWSSYETSITSIIISDGVTSICNYAFEDFRYLTSITIPDSITSIGNDAFSRCTALTSINIPDSVTSIGRDAFHTCTALTSIAIPASITSIGWDAFNSCSALESVYITDIAAWCSISFSNSYSNPLYYGNNLYLNGELAEEIIIPDGATTIGGYAFYKCSSLTSITIPDSITSIGSNAFTNCSALSEVNCNKSDDFWFAIELGTGNSYFLQLCGIYMDSCGDDLTWRLNANTGTLKISGTGDMDDYSSSNNAQFYRYAEYITSVTIDEGITNISNYTFCNCSNLTSITLPEGITSIGKYAFHNCSSLINIIIPDSVTNIDTYAFDNCSSLTSITIPESVTNISKNTFSNCTSLISVTIPNSVTSIGQSAFSYCKSLTSVTIPNSITSIGQYVFSNCKSLTSVTIPDSVRSISYYAFYSCGSLNFTVDENNSYYSSVDGVLFNKDQTTLIAYAKDVINPEYTIPDGVTSLYMGAFYSCTGLTSVTIPNSVTSIGEDAFYGCDSLTDVYYDGTSSEWSAITIGKYNTALTSATIHCTDDSGVQVYGGTCGTNLTWTLDPETGTMTISGTGKMTNYDEDDPTWCNYIEMITSIIIEDGVTSISDYAFRDCTNLTSVIMPDTVTRIGDYAFSDCTSLSSITIGNNVTYIGECAFEYCALTSIIIPDSVVTIGWGAFYCCESLASVTLGSSVSYIDWDVFAYTALTSIVIPEGVPTIDEGAFSNCTKLKSVTIPISVNLIVEGAFAECVSLTDVYYNGSEKDWNDILLYTKDNSYLLNATFHFADSGSTDPTGITFAAVGKYEDAAEAEVIINEDGEVTIDLTITDKSALSASNVTVYAVSYSGNTVEAIEQLSKTITTDGATFSGSVSGAYKIFIWDENMQPITAPVE